jgi:hypothetical protein
VTAQKKGQQAKSAPVTLSDYVAASVAEAGACRRLQLADNAPGQMGRTVEGRSLLRRKRRAQMVMRQLYFGNRRRDFSTLVNLAFLRTPGQGAGSDKNRRHKGANCKEPDNNSREHGFSLEQEVTFVAARTTLEFTLLIFACLRSTGFGQLTDSSIRHLY